MACGLYLNKVVIIIIFLNRQCVEREPPETTTSWIDSVSPAVAGNLLENKALLAAHLL